MAAHLPMITRKIHTVRWLPFLAAVSLVSGGANPAQKPQTDADKVTVTATAYSYGVACNGSWPKRNAVGGSLKSGEVNSAAADWSKFPVGTKFRVVETGKVYLVDDYGSAMVGKNKVDLYMPNYSQVDRWGVRSVTLEIIEWGSPEKSLEILKPRARMGYIRRMVASLETKLSDDEG